MLENFTAPETGSFPDSIMLRDLQLFQAEVTRNRTNDIEARTNLQITPENQEAELIARYTQRLGRTIRYHATNFSKPSSSRVAGR